MPETIKAAELPMVGIFNNNYRFEIPDYQRPYSWTTEEVGELLDDLLYAVGQPNNLADASPYFLGSVVIIKSDASRKAEIIDGQQRITTLTILLCALRELTSDAERRITRHEYIREKSDLDAGIEGRYRLSIRERDREFFQSNIQERDKLNDFVKHPQVNLPESQQRMFENAKFLWDELSKLDESNRNALMAYIIQHCYLVIVSTTDQASAYRIFSVLNDRGLDLSPTDILKAQIIGRIEDDNTVAYTKIWEDEEEDLGRDGFRNLFTHVRMIHLKNKMRRALQDEFWESVLKVKKGEKLSPAKAKHFIDEVLEPYSDLYEVISTASFQGQADSDNEKINRYLRYLNRLDNFDWIPPALEFFIHNKDESDRLAGFVKDLERLAYGMFVRRANINERINRYAEILRAIQNSEELFEDDAELQLRSEEKLDIVKALEGSVYSQVRVRRPLLLRLDSMLAGGGATYTYPIISIEHVLPQNPQKCSQWRKWFPDDEVRDFWTHRLANLVLLSHRKNSAANNREFYDKKEKYFKTKDGISPFALTTHVIKESDWTPNVLERRQKELIDLLKKEWRLG